MLSFVFSINKNFYSLYLIFNFLSLILVVYLWTKDMSRERVFVGSMSLVISCCVKMAFTLFIVREVLFFLSFFWAYFHFILVSPRDLILWPPFILSPPSFKTLALLNTGLLLSRGFTLTNAHQFLLLNNKKIFKSCNKITLRLSVMFLFSQNVEYKLIGLLFTDRVFSSIFYITTLFHGIHVLVGRIFIAISTQEWKFRFFEIAAWYWHFVDIVWLFLFLFFYWWVY